MLSNTQINTIPSRVFDRRIDSLTLREIFEMDEAGNYLKFDATEDRSTCCKKYRIALHQRYNKWGKCAKNTIIESIWLNYIIGSISLSQHHDGSDGFYFDIEDGQSRLTVIQEYLTDKFSYCDKLFSETSSLQQNRFMDYKFPVEITTLPTTRGSGTTLIEDHYYENFDRINRGKPLSDNDKYWCRKDTVLVKFTINLILKFNTETGYEFMKTHMFGKKNNDGKVNRDVLEKIVTMVGAFLYGVYKKSYSRHMYKMRDDISQTNIIRFYDFMKFYKSIYDSMVHIMPREDNEQIPFNNPGKFMGLIIMDYNDDTSIDSGIVKGIPYDYKKDMWINILNIDRNSDDFMKGTQTLWNGFVDADKKNQEKSNIETRLKRIRDFYIDREAIKAAHHIEFNSQ